MVRSFRVIAAYDAQFDPIRAARNEKSGKQAGDPAKLAQAVLALINADAPAPQLLLGSDALRLVSERYKHMERKIDEWEGLTLSADG